jgi:AcrR family transcriptional regulator
MSKTRARSPEKKAAQFKKIIDEGRKLFLSVGSQGFSMRAIARKMKMEPGNLYNYVASKRELWFAVIRDDFIEFTKGMEEITKKQQGPYMDLLKKIGKYYLEFASQDFERYRMMFMTPAPPSDSIGPIEAAYKPKSFEIMMEIVQKAISNDEITETNAIQFTIYIWGIIHGNVELSNPETFLPKQYSNKVSNEKQHIDYVSKQIDKIVDLYKK